MCLIAWSQLGGFDSEPAGRDGDGRTHGFQRLPWGPGRNATQRTILVPTLALTCAPEHLLAYKYVMTVVLASSLVF